jgi:ubiquinone/menaquinone biosynthesis C-methylase UbiE
MPSTLAGLFGSLPRPVQRPLRAGWYELLSLLDHSVHMTFMNYGWASLAPAAQPLTLQPKDEPNRYCIQLYHRVASAIDLRGLDVLEIGCGRGGGASYVKRYLHPRSLTGLDLTFRAVAFCKRHYAAIPGLVFVRGRAEAPQFGDETFDAVLNVESSHCYADMPRFLASVRRVLKPGGHFLFADFRAREEVDTLRRRLQDAGLNLLAEENISANVVRALEMDNTRKQELIDRRVPKALRGLFDEFAGMQGTHSAYASLRRGDKLYLRYVLQK